MDSNQVPPTTAAPEAEKVHVGVLLAVERGALQRRD
jgi:hypothetical protein